MKKLIIYGTGLVAEVAEFYFNVDTDYEARRADAFLVAVNCFEPAGTCFCVSMGTGPKADVGYDLSRPEDCRRVVRETAEGLGSLDFLVHSAANFHRATLQETDENLWDSAMDVNARAGFLMAREAAPVLRERGGRIVLISDFLAESPARNYVAHSVSKAAVEGLVRALAVELGPEIPVNGVAPGTVLPPEGTTAEEVERLARRVPARRIGTADDVGAAVVFLCAGPAFVTGQVLRVDGGRSIV